jgi:hypothetical protein
VLIAVTVVFAAELRPHRDAGAGDQRTQHHPGGQYRDPALRSGN